MKRVKHFQNHFVDFPLRENELRFLSIVSMLILCALASGCNGDGENSTSETNISQPDSAENDLPSTATNVLQAKPADVLNDNTGQDHPAAKDVYRLLAGLAKENPRALWEFLPPRYQQDLNKVIRKFADSLDEELWMQLVATLRKTNDVLKSKKAYIIDTPLASGSNLDVKQRELLRAEAERKWQVVTNTLDAFLESDLADLDNFRKADGGRILETTGRQLLTHIAAMAAANGDDAEDFRTALTSLMVEAETEVDGRVMVTLRVKPADGFQDSNKPLPAMHVEFVQVQAHWIPKNLRDGWQPNLQSIQSQLDLFQSEGLAEKKPALLRLLRTVDEMMLQLAKASSTEEFATTLQQTMPTVQTAADGLQTPTEPGSEDGVMVIVQGGPFSGEMDEEIQVHLGAAADNSDLGIAIPSNFGHSVQYEVTPVKDVAKFAEKIPFGRVISVDSQKRIVTVEITTP